MSIKADQKAVIVTDRNPAETRKLAIRRVISTAIGAACGVMPAQVLSSSSSEAAIAIFVAMMLSIAVTQLGDPKLAAYLAALIIINFHDNPVHYAFYRFAETLIGAQPLHESHTGAFLVALCYIFRRVARPEPAESVGPVRLVALF